MASVLQNNVLANVLERPLRISGGVECTFNRVGSTYFDQVELSGHAYRPGDFDTIAGIGIDLLRFGVSWERFACEGWAWTDRCMQTMDQLQIQPIAGLVHHGSGPRDTDLLDVEFPQKLSRYAASVAERYPHISAYTPVNEPNTTARFSGLYGQWFPHHRSHTSYLRALLNQAKGTALSMEAIRRVRPDARLIQTDDCGSISSTPELQSTAELLHARQWLTFDLLFGKVDRIHPMFAYMRSHGIAEHEIFWFQDHPCPPQVIGVNYYATSDRFLDHRRQLYPASLASSEGPFIDVESVRVEGLPTSDFSRPLQEAYARYQTPVALTEVHLGGPWAEQIRWLAAAHTGISRAKQCGVPCEFLTVWALLGSYFWNELVTRDNGYYEPGAFDVRSGLAEPTPLATFVAQLAAGKLPDHPALDEPGWWERADRACYLLEPAEEIKAA